MGWIDLGHLARQTALGVGDASGGRLAEANGIARGDRPGEFWLTGKWWPKLVLARQAEAADSLSGVCTEFAAPDLPGSPILGPGRRRRWATVADGVLAPLP